MEPAKRQARRLASIHRLIKDFSEALETHPFNNKMDEAKVKGLMNDIRKVLANESLPKKQVVVDYYEPEEVEPVDPASAIDWIEKINKTRKEKHGKDN